LRRAEGEAYRIVLTPPGTAQRHRDDMAGNAAPRAGCVRPAGGFRPRSDLFQIASLKGARRPFARTLSLRLAVQNRASHPITFEEALPPFRSGGWRRPPREPVPNR
jgi:hypothetical protein